MFGLERTNNAFMYILVVGIFLTILLLIGVLPKDVHAVTATSDEVQSVDTGDGTTCAVRKNRAYCWGQDIAYGYSNYTTKTTPQLVTSSVISNKLVTKVTVGVNHACLLAAAKVYCWGLNNNGQLGDGTTTDRPTPTPVDTSTALKGAEIMDVSAGDGFTCALATTGVTSCWGSRADGRIGAGNGMSGLELYPKAVYANGSLSGKRAIRLARASNATMCAIVTPASNANATSGDVNCWGFGINNGNGIPGSTTTGCLDAAPATTTTYFKSDKPVLISGATGHECCRPAW